MQSPVNIGSGTEGPHRMKPGESFSSWATRTGNVPPAPELVVPAPAQYPESSVEPKATAPPPMIIPAGLTLTVSPPGGAEAKAPDAVATSVEEAELYCGICWELLFSLPRVTLRCAHTFHSECVDGLVAHLGQSKDIPCPTCRTGRH